MILEISLIIVTTLLITASYIIYNLYKKYSVLEETAIDNQEFIMAMRNRVITHRSYLRQIDRSGAFEADDEVGYFFIELKKIINDISSYFDITTELNTDDQKNIIPTTPRNGVLIERLKDNGNQ